MNEACGGVTKGNQIPMTSAVQHRYRRFEMRFQTLPDERADQPQPDDETRLTLTTRYGPGRDADSTSPSGTPTGHFVRQPVKVHLIPRSRLVR